MGSITEELQEALKQAKDEGEVIVRITFYQSAWTSFTKESSPLKGVNGEGQRTFDGIPVVPNERDPISPRFVLETK